MAGTWVQLKTIQHIEVNGKTVTRHPGDWVEVGKQTAKRWIAEGSAHIPIGGVIDALPSGCGIVAWGSNTVLPDGIHDIKDLDWVYSETPQLQFPRTLLWNAHVPLRLEKIAAGFVVLDAWDMAVPLCDYDTLAGHLGTATERSTTAASIGDLRVPVYEPSLMWIKRSETTRLFLSQLRELWQTFDQRLAFLRVLHEIKPLIAPLPYTWAIADGADKYGH